MGWLGDLKDDAIDIVVGVAAPTTKNAISATIGTGLVLGGGVAWLTLEATEAIAETDWMDADESTLEFISNNKEFAKGVTASGVDTVTVAAVDQGGVLTWDERSSVVQGLEASSNVVSSNANDASANLFEAVGMDDAGASARKSARRDREQTQEAFDRMATNQWYAQYIEESASVDDEFMVDQGIVWESDSAGKQWLQDTIFNPVRHAAASGTNYVDAEMGTDGSIVSDGTEYVFENYTEEAVILAFGVLIGSAVLSAIAQGAISGAASTMLSLALRTGAMTTPLLTWLLANGWISDDDIDELEKDEELEPPEPDPVIEPETEPLIEPDVEPEPIVEPIEVIMEPEPWDPDHDAESLFAENEYLHVEVNY